MNRTLFVPDLHGRINIVKSVLDNWSDDIVFVGDYVDSFDRTTKDQFNTIMTVVKAAEDEPERITALIGNHDHSYLYKSTCSGWNTIMDVLLFTERERIIKVLKWYTWVGNTLVTHAGLSKNRVLQYGNVKDALQKQEDTKKIYPGYARGGNNPVPGYLWCDYWQEFEPVPGINQVFGHTALRHKYGATGILMENNEDGNGYKAFNIDCLDSITEYLMLDEEGNFYILNDDFSIKKTIV